MKRHACGEVTRVEGVINNARGGQQPLTLSPRADFIEDHRARTIRPRDG